MKKQKSLMEDMIKLPNYANKNDKDKLRYKRNCKWNNRSNESSSFKSRIKKAALIINHGMPGSGFYYHDSDREADTKLGKFEKEKKFKKFINYNNSI